MLAVYKYQCPFNDKFALQLPKDATLLHADMQHDVLCLWALVNPSNEVEKRQFRLAATGHPISHNVEHISTFLMDDGALVFHLFEIV